jgi:hypothetical protein
MQRLYIAGDEMKCDPRMAPREPIYEGGNEACRQKLGAANPHFPSGRIGQKFDALHALTEIIEDGGPATQQGAAALGRFNSLPVAIEQPDAERILKITDCSRNVRLSGIQDSRRLAHAAGLRHRHEYVQILQLQSASDAIAHPHGAPISVLR